MLPSEELFELLLLEEFEELFELLLLDEFEELFELLLLEEFDELFELPLRDPRGPTSARLPRGAAAVRDAGSSRNPMAAPALRMPPSQALKNWCTGVLALGAVLAGEGVLAVRLPVWAVAPWAMSRLVTAVTITLRFNGMGPPEVVLQQTDA